MQDMNPENSTFKSTRKSTQKMKKKKETCPKYSLRSMNYMPISDTDQCEWHSLSSSPRITRSEPRNARHPGPSVVQPHWSMSALMAALPESPESETYYSEIASEFSIPRNQSCGNSCNDNNVSSCFSDIDEWLEHANKFCRPFNSQTSYLIETDSSQRNSSPDDQLSISPMCKSFCTAPDHDLYSIALPSIREESPEYQGQCHLRCINSICEATKCGNCKDEMRKFRSWQKPCDAYLNEVKRQKLEAKREAWKKAKHARLIDRMRRKEAAINDWELQQTRKALEEMEKFQNNLESKLLVVSANTHKKICLVKEKAQMQKAGLRLSTMRRIQKLQSPETHSPAEISCVSSFPFF